MKLSDFTMQEINVADDGQPPKQGLWKSGSRSNLMGIGNIGSKKYQVKVHAGEPKWYMIDKQVTAKKAEIRNCPADDWETKQRLESELNSLNNSKASYDEKDSISDAYLDYKKRLIAKIASAHDPLIVCPADFWKEPIEKKSGGVVPSANGAVFSAEAVPWVGNVAVGFDASSPVVFNRDLDKNTQYKIIASLAERLDKLHSVGVIHGDLKIGNTLIVKEGGQYKVALIDFDAAINLDDLHRDKIPFGAWYYIVGGTYFSLETQLLFNICREGQDLGEYNEFDKTLVNEKADIFGLGITIYEYFYGRADMGSVMPFKNTLTGEILDQPLYGLAVAQDYAPDLPDSMDELLYSALNWMLAQDPAERPTARQVRDVFLNQDISIIPSKFTRNPLWPEDQEIYKIVPTDGVTVLKGLAPHKYRIKRGPTTVNRNINDLFKEGIVARLDGAAPTTPSAPPVDPDKDKTWDDKRPLPKCAVRSDKEGWYTVYISGFSKTVRKDYLISEGILCDAGDVTKPWPCDSGLMIVTSKHVERDLGKFKGPGHYKVGTGVAAIQYTTKRLIEQGLACFGITFKLFPRDEELYETNPSAVPNTVASIIRDSITGKAYIIINHDGSKQKLSPDEMLAHGYIKRK